MGTKCYAVIFHIDLKYFSVSCKTFLITLATSLHDCDREGKKTYGPHSSFFYTFVYLVLITVMKAKTSWSYSLRR